ncbi:unnamed protein product [Paramecium octaurelia]|uniref:Uncharacterized protein n=1 Tax=Paramecium octaurelia TaxID=43137 RepID=A0A8S1XMI3_PAROT|nr:unnamed protein product [Paramecium octaurelia]
MRCRVLNYRDLMQYKNNEVKYDEKNIQINNKYLKQSTFDQTQNQSETNKIQNMVNQDINQMQIESIGFYGGIRVRNFIDLKVLSIHFGRNQKIILRLKDIASYIAQHQKKEVMKVRYYSLRQCEERLKSFAKQLANCKN